MPGKKRISERKIIILTGGLLIFAGLVRLANYSVGIVLFYLSFIPYYVVRIKNIRNSMGTETPPVERYRVLILVAMFITICLNIIGWQEANFLLIFFLMLDYILLTNRTI